MKQLIKEYREPRHNNCTKFKRERSTHFEKLHKGLFLFLSFSNCIRLDRGVVLSVHSFHRLIAIHNKAEMK